MTVTFARPGLNSLITFKVDFKSEGNETDLFSLISIMNTNCQ